MKKFLIFSAMLGAMAFAVPSVEAKSTASASADPQIRVQIGPQRNRRVINRRVRTVTRTRITRIGRYRYRETIRVTYLPNGRTRTQVISRTRIGGRNW
ncbi:MAG: hypothetical protein AAB288_00200 [Acidobacteriota bacterium]